MDPKAPEAGAADAGPSKSALKKAEAKAKKEALKAQRAAERAATQVAAIQLDDPSKDFYGRVTPTSPAAFSPDAREAHLRDLGAEHEGKSVIIRGWLQNSRIQSAKMAFIELREEGNWAVQGVVLASAPDAPEGTHPVSRPMVKYIGSTNAESFVAVEAVVKKPYEPVKSCRVADWELHLTRFFLVAPAPAMLGLTMAAANRAVTNFSDEEVKPAAEGEEAAKPAEAAAESGPAPAASMLTHLDNIAMHKRAPVQQAIADIRMEAKHLFRSYLRERGFKEFEPPCLIGASSEGGANVFRLPYFNQEAFLAQSPQFYKQFEIAGGRKRVFSIGPVFRAENSNTPRHMTEFTGLDLEMEIKEDYTEVRDMLEGVLLHMFRSLQENCKEEIALVRSVYPSEDILLPEPGKEVRLTFAEGQKLLREEGPEEFRNVSDDEDMSTPQEKALGALVRKKFNTDFYVLDKFPETARPFYAKLDPLHEPKEGGAKLCLAYDFCLRGQEILSVRPLPPFRYKFETNQLILESYQGGQRINDPDELEERIRAKGIDPKSPGICDYVDVFRQVGVPPHGGGGIGLDRVVAWLLALPSVHLASYYPRTPKRLLP